jgi:predicted RND superfamily exporter protein
MQRIAGFVLRRPWTIVIAFALLCVGAQQSIDRFAVYDLSARPVTPDGSRGIEIHDEFEQLFGADDDSYMMAFAAEDTVLDNESLELIERLTERIEAIPDTLSVTSLTNILDMRSGPMGMDVVPFVGPLPLSAVELDDLRTRLPNDPVISGLLVSGDRKSAGMIVRMLPDALEPDRRKIYFDQLEVILAEDAPGVKVHRAGWPFLRWTLQNHLESDATWLLPWVNLVFAVLLWLAFRQIRMVWIPMLPVIVSSMMTLGTLVLTGKPMTMLTAEGLLTTLVMVIGLSDGVHLVDRYRQESALNPTATGFEPLVAAIKHVGMACLLTSITTAIGFSGLISSLLPAIRDFGIFGSLGIFYAFAASVLFLPACIVLVERKWASKPLPPKESLWTTAILTRVSDFVITRPGVCILAGLLVLGVSIGFGTRVRID